MQSAIKMIPLILAIMAFGAVQGIISLVPLRLNDGQRKPNFVGYMTIFQSHPIAPVIIKCITEHLPPRPYLIAVHETSEFRIHREYDKVAIKLELNPASIILDRGFYIPEVKVNSNGHTVIKDVWNTTTLQAGEPHTLQNRLIAIYDAAEVLNATKSGGVYCIALGEVASPERND